MKTLKHIFAVAALAALVASCSSYSYTSRSVSIAQSMDVRPTQTLVDVRPDFQTRITATSSMCKTPSEAMAEAKYKAITENRIDIVVDPIYEMEHRGRKFRAKLSGFAGYYTNPRTALEEIRQHDSISIEAIEKYLMLQNGSMIIPYLYQQKPEANHVTIYNTNEEKNVMHHEECKEVKKADKPRK